SRLERELDTGNHEEVRAAALILGRIGRDSTRRELRRVLFGDRGDRSRPPVQHLAMALGLLGDADDELPLLQLLRATKREEDRRGILMALGRLGGSASIEVLKDLWRHEKGRVFRASMLLAAGRIRHPEALSIIRLGLSDTKEIVRRAATLALADLRDVEHFNDLRRRLSDTDEDVVRHALIGCALVRHPKMASVLRSKLRDGDESIRALTVTALGAQGDAESLELLLARAAPRGERHERVLAALAFALARYADQGADEALRRLLSLPHPDVVRAGLLASLGRVQASTLVLPEVIKRERNDEVRRCALEMLAFRSATVFRELARTALERGEDKKSILALMQELLEILDKEPVVSHAILAARLQVMIDELGGSPEWNLLAA
ncbi:MAG: HEAT repeat domain-containing protein, partial [Planctomycetes bacterium]|nr:HEAT repeat domain-containing protein [Planctomycetota bacterium]